jgi:hypothetical protein
MWLNSGGNRSRGNDRPASLLCAHRDCARRRRGSILIRINAKARKTATVALIQTSGTTWVAYSSGARRRTRSSTADSKPARRPQALAHRRKNKSALQDLRREARISICRRSRRRDPAKPPEPVITADLNSRRHVQPSAVDQPQCLSAPPWSKRFMDRDRPEQTPVCPSCGRPMPLVRAVAQTGAQPELSTYECRICGVMLTAAREPTRASESA